MKMSNVDGSEPGLRERNKLKRRDSILDAALSILDDEPAASVAVDRVATLAELSPATVYNLVGGRDDIVRAIMVRIIEHTTAEARARFSPDNSDDDPLWMSRHRIAQGTKMLVQRPGAHRRLLVHLGGLGSGSMTLKGTDGTKMDAPNLHVETMRHAQKKGLIRKSLDSEVLGTLIANGYNGALLRWASGGIEDQHLAPLGCLGLVSIAASACTSSYRTNLEREMAALSRKIAAPSP
jgi:AcrR family transcriptional regulator